MRNALMPCGRVLLLLLATVLLTPCAASAQAAPTPPQTLAAALTQAKAPAKGITLAVDAARTALPKDAAPTDAQSSVADVADAYGRDVRDFGVVTAVAPPTMVVINASPSDPNPYDGMPSSDALALLCAGLSDAQWQSLTGAEGLGAGELLTESQRQLFVQTLSGGKLKVVPLAARHNYRQGEERDLTDQLGQARLRLAQSVQFQMPIAGEPGSYYAGLEAPPAPDAPPSYLMVDRRDYDGSRDTLYGVKVRAEEPNEPKEGQLDLSAKALQASIPLIGLKTVGDLVARIARTTRTELYADPRLESQPLTLAGPAKVAPAADLLRAVAFCLTGTFRQVGPAYVVTDDVAGVGTRRQIWWQFEQYGDALRAQAVYEAENTVFSRHSPRDVSAFGDPSAFTPDQDRPDPASHSFFSASVNPEVHPRIYQSLAQFSPAQQATIRRTSALFNSTHQSRLTTLDSPVGMVSRVNLQLLIPTLDGPIDMGISEPMESLFQMPPDVADRRQKAQQALMEEKYRKPPPMGAVPKALAGPPVTVAQALAVVPRRAVLVRAKTAAQVDADIAAMKALGLNQLWLDVFSDGHAHIPDVPQSDVAESSLKADILTEALAKTRGTGIRVFPVLDLLAWGPSPPDEAADRTILGETTAQATARWQQIKELMRAGHTGMYGENTTGGVTPSFPGVAVCPLAPTVRNALVTLVGDLSARPGVAGIVWRETDPPGYDLPSNGDDTSGLLVGYHEAMRLAFLRKYHADPLDIFTVGNYMGLADTDVPNFSTNSVSAQISNTLELEWRQFRNDAATGLLRALWATSSRAGDPAMPRRVILVKQRRRGQGGNADDGRTVYPPGWFGSWDTPHLPLPTLHSYAEDAPPDKPPLPVADETTQAAQQSHLVYTRLTDEELPFLRDNPAQARDEWRKHPLTGLVLDFSDAAPDDAPLPKLAKGAAPAKKP